jgi:uncharacterized protein (DUF4415 family)
MTANRKSIGSNLTKVDRHIVRKREYDEAPELTADELARAEVRVDGKVVRRGRPPLARPKEAVKLRLSGEVLDHFRSGGAGWQTRINETLERAVKRARRAPANRIR